MYFNAPFPSPEPPGHPLDTPHCHALRPECSRPEEGGREEGGREGGRREGGREGGGREGGREGGGREIGEVSTIHTATVTHLSDGCLQPCGQPGAVVQSARRRLLHLRKRCF